MRFTRKHSDCNDGTCPAIWDTDDPQLVGVQGAVTPVWPPGPPVPPGEQVVLIPRELLDSYLKESPVTDLPACFDLFERSAVRIETLPAYDVPAEAEVLRAFARGLPLPERSTRTSPWLARIARTTAAGKSWSRTRVTGWPLTGYERFQLAYGYPPSEQAGEVIRVASRAEHPELAALGGDFWLFDGDTASPFAALMSYDGHGGYLGSEVTDDPGVIARCRAQAALAARCAVPLGAFPGTVTA